MADKVYIETSVVSYYTARHSADPVVAGRQESTRKFWPYLNERLDGYISDLVLQEAQRGDTEQAHGRMDALEPFAVLDADDDAKSLAKEIIARKGVPESCPEDALHIAIAAVNGMHLLVTWNFGHINNPFTRIAVRRIVENAGYACPEICSPDELLGDET